MRPPSKSARRMRRSGIREIMDFASEAGDVLHLEVGEPSFPTPAHIVDAAAAAARDGYTTYTPNEGLREVRASMARKLEVENGLSVSPDEIVVTTGGVNAIVQALIVLLDPGEGLLIPDPGWPNYEMMADLLGFEVVHYPLDPETGFEPDLETLTHLVRSTPGVRVLLLNSPGNPTGSVFRRRTLEQLLEIAAAADLSVVSDECYDRIVFEGEHVSPASLDPSGRVISVFSVSKTYAMTGWRIGYVAARAELAAMIAKVQEALTSCANAVAQKAAQAALDGDQTCVAEMREAYRHRRDVAVGMLEREDILLSRPRGAFYIMASTRDVRLDGYAFCKRLVEEHRVAVAPGETFGPGGTGTIRISLAAGESALEEGIPRIGEAVRSWSAGDVAR